MNYREVMGRACVFMEFYASHLPTSVDDWRTLLQRANDLCIEYGETKFVTAIVGEVVNEIERLYKNEQKG